MIRYFFLFFIGFSLSAQVKGVVINSVSGDPVPYASISVEGKNLGTTAEADGSYAIRQAPDPQTELVFSAIGFETRKIKNSEAATVKLQPVRYELDEVKIAQSKGVTATEIGESKKKGLYQISFGSLPWIFAKYFPYEKKYEATPFIRSATVYTSSTLKGALFRLRIYKVGPDGAPGEDLVAESIVISVKKGKRKNTIDLSQYHLALPQNGIFIAFEHMFIERNFDVLKKSEWTGRYVGGGNYEPRILTYPAQRQYSFVGGEGGGWLKQAKSNDPAQPLWEPAINLTLTD